MFFAWLGVAWLGLPCLALPCLALPCLALPCLEHTVVSGTDDPLVSYLLLKCLILLFLCLAAVHVMFSSFSGLYFVFSHPVPILRFFLFLVNNLIIIIVFLHKNIAPLQKQKIHAFWQPPGGEVLQGNDADPSLCPPTGLHDLSRRLRQRRS